MYHDLRAEAAAKRLPMLIGRAEELDRLDRLLGQRARNNAFIVGPAGCGKTALAWGWMRRLNAHPRYAPYALLQFDAEHIHALADDDALAERYAEALASVPRAVVCIDDFGREVYKDAEKARRVFRLYKRLLSRPDVHVVFTLQPQEHAWLLREYPAFARVCETITLKEQTAFEYSRIVRSKMPLLNAQHHVIVSDDAIDEIVSLAGRYPALGQMPRAAIHLLDESLSVCASRGASVLTQKEIAHVVETKTGIPKAHASRDALEGVRHLEDRLNERVVSQRAPIAKIAATLTRAKLGLRNPNRPLGSFLLLGPSGVGKTETAKSVAEIMFGRADCFLRIDMSEFQQEHTVQRLIGAPPGYIGYEASGAIINALKREPHSLILLDEIEKAHPKVFDIFLQILDDGRLTSGQGETVDAREAIIMATSNAAVSEILDACANGRSADDDSFVRDIAMPILAHTFRLEFLNRFDAILVFNPLPLSGLMSVARLEIAKIERRLAKHKVRFSIESDVLEERIRRIADPRFGARPVKRFIEETCETLLAETLLSANTAKTSV